MFSGRVQYLAALTLAVIFSSSILIPANSYAGKRNRNLNPNKAINKFITPVAEDAQTESMRMWGEASELEAQIAQQVSVIQSGAEQNAAEPFFNAMQSSFNAAGVQGQFSQLQSQINGLPGLQDALTGRLASLSNLSDLAQTYGAAYAESLLNAQIQIAIVSSGSLSQVLSNLQGMADFIQNQMGDLPDIPNVDEITNLLNGRPNLVQQLMNGISGSAIRVNRLKNYFTNELNVQLNELMDLGNAGDSAGMISRAQQLISNYQTRLGQAQGWLSALRNEEINVIRPDIARIRGELQQAIDDGDAALEQQLRAQLSARLGDLQINLNDQEKARTDIDYFNLGISQFTDIKNIAESVSASGAAAGVANIADEVAASLGLISGTGEQLTQTEQQMQDFFNGLGETDAVQQLSGLMGWGSQLGSVANGGIVSIASNQLTQYKAQGQSILNNLISSGIAGATGAIGEAIGAIGDALGDIGDVLSQAQSLLPGVLSQLNNLQSIMNSAVSTASSAINRIMSLANTANGLLSQAGFLSNLQSISGTLNNAFNSQIFNNIKDQMGSVTDKFTKVIDWLKKIAETIKNTVPGLVVYEGTFYVPEASEAKRKRCNKKCKKKAKRKFVREVKKAAKAMRANIRHTLSENWRAIDSQGQSFDESMTSLRQDFGSFLAEYS